MPGSIGSSPACRRPRRKRWLLACALLWPALPAFAELPDYFRAALATFGTEPPPGWSYTVETVRNDNARTTARYDPSVPPNAQWTLLELNGRVPTPQEAAQYARARSGAGGAAPQATFRKEDIDPGSVILLKEDAERAEFQARFREVATGSDKMLGHLALRLTINKRLPHVEQAVLELTEPYSPVLGVKMRELVVRMTFTAPADGRPSLPGRNHSHFAGRIFFIGTEENLVLTYSEFRRAR